MNTTADQQLALTREQQRTALAQHLTLHRVGADERWDGETLQALHAFAHRD